jgi:RimJ/RimL family protein N-acetyltransferase
MYLVNGKLVIRNATAADAQILCNWWNDGKVMAHAGFPHGLGTTTQQIALDLTNDSDDKHRRLILELDTVPIGEMAYSNKGKNIAEIGIKICDFTKQEYGFGTIFLKMLIESLFNDMGYEKIILDTNLNNTRAQHVYENIGFKKVAIKTNSWKNQLGELQSAVDYALTKNDYLNINK